MSMPQVITDEELILVKDYILYPVILDVLERDIGKMKLIDLKIPMVYIGNLKHIQNLVTHELTYIKRELRRRGIKIYEQERSINGIKAKYVCRRYNHEISFLPSLIRSIVIEKLAQLMSVDVTKDIL